MKLRVGDRVVVSDKQRRVATENERKAKILYKMQRFWVLEIETQIENYFECYHVNDIEVGNVVLKKIGG